jgi:hypothetical protein
MTRKIKNLNCPHAMVYFYLASVSGSGSGSEVFDQRVGSIQLSLSGPLQI